MAMCSPNRRITAFESGQFNLVPVINGTNDDEYRYFAALIDVNELVTEAGGMRISRW